MNPGDMSLEDGPCIVIKAFPCISLVTSIGSIGSTVEDVSVVSRDCEDRSKRSTIKGFFLNLQVICRLMEGWSGNLDEYE